MRVGGSGLTGTKTKGLEEKKGNDIKTKLRTTTTIPEDLPSASSAGRGEVTKTVTTAPAQKLRNSLI